jgi:predicted TIM-barrel fold metal-dependent hydrolase
MEKLTVISLDSHAQTPSELWETYLEKRFHHYLPALREENEIYTSVMRTFWSRNYNESKWPIFDLDGAFQAGGVKGLYDFDTRLAEMDREGIAAEFIYNGDARVCGLFFQSSNREYPMDVCQAGVKAYHRWLGDASSKAKERLLPIGILGSAPWRSMDEMLQELDFIADRGFVGTAIPGYASYHGELPLFDKYWDPFWARCEERGIALWVHAGHGERQGELGKVVHKFHRQVTEEGGDIEELVKRLVKEIFNGQLFSSAKPRRAMWQMMMGGVFDRFPRLKLVMNEVYGDWIPAMLRHLDGAFETHRAALPAKR